MFSRMKARPRKVTRSMSPRRTTTWLEWPTSSWRHSSMTSNSTTTSPSLASRGRWVIMGLLGGRKSCTCINDSLKMLTIMYQYCRFVSQCDKHERTAVLLGRKHQICSLTSEFCSTLILTVFHTFSWNITYPPNHPPQNGIGESKKNFLVLKIK